jgi:hypothetical protein
MPKVLVVTLILFSTNVLFAQSVKLRLRVLDSSGAVIPKVQVKVYQADKLVGEGLTSSTGDFDIPVDPGDYMVEITAADFQPHVENVKVTGDSVPLVVTMKLAQLNQTIDVKDVVNQVSIDADSSLKTTVLEKEFVEALPDEVDDLVAYLQQLLDRAARLAPMLHS